MLDTILGLIICGVLLNIFISGGLEEMDDKDEVDGKISNFIDGALKFIDGALNAIIKFGLCLIGWMVSLVAFIYGLKLIF